MEREKNRILLEKEKEYRPISVKSNELEENEDLQNKNDDIKDELNQEENIDENLMPENEWKEISKELPLEFHIELIKHC